jgi:hypothetical protein
MFKKINCIFFNIFVISLLSVLPSYATMDLDLRVPNTPTKLTLKALSDSEVKLEWKDNSDNEMAFEIYQNGEFVYVTDANVTSQIISDLQAGTTYSFKVIASNDVGKSYSTQSRITTDYIVKNRELKKRKINIVKLKPKNIKKIDPPIPSLSVSSIDERFPMPRGHAIHKEQNMKICSYKIIEDDVTFVDIFPPHGISWSGSDLSSIKEIERSFNHARSFDKTVSKYLKMPLQSKWDSWDIQQKALYLLNSEREARGIKPFDGVSSLVIEVAQNYADLLQQIGNIAYYESDEIPKLSFSIKSKKDFYGFAEAVSRDIVSDSDAIVKSIYSWIYLDNEKWKNRKFIFSTNLNDNSVVENREGLLGIGISNGNYQIVTMNAFDPSSSFDDPSVIYVDTTKSAKCMIKK